MEEKPWKKENKVGRRENREGMYRIEKYALAFVIILMAIVLFLAFMSHNTVKRSRNEGTYTVLEDVVFTQVEDADAPIGIADEYRFTLDEIQHADMLVFYINHHNIRVCLDGENVFDVKNTGKQFHTTGAVWSMIPLDESDSGKEVCVVLSPLYENYKNQSTEFLVGSELAIYKAVMEKALPEMMLSICVVVTGLILLVLALYYSRMKKFIRRLYAIGTLSVCAGIWRFTYGSFVYLLFPEHTVFIVTLSILSLMFVALAMLNCVELNNKKKYEKPMRLLLFAYKIVYAIQLLLQIFGVVDLRRTLSLIHCTIIISAVLLCISGGYSLIHPKEVRGGFMEGNDSWLIGIGAMVDFLLYRYAKTPVGMLFTLVTILCYSLFDGIRIVRRFTDQEKALEEMETKLIISRTTTMMSQIRSHFVFNILNAISGMCKYDPVMADNTVVRFARYLRNNIDIMENDKNIPFTTDLRQLEDYVVLEQARFGDKIEFYTDIEEDNFMIPPLILQPVVENAIRHGVSKKEGNGSIILKTRKMGENIIITVEDDGIGFDMEKLKNDKSVGLKNIRFRLRYLADGTLDIASQVNKGTVVTITIPKKESEKI